MTTIAEIKANGKCALEYGPGTREWCVGRPDGKILTFPAGQEGKLAAQMSALTHDIPAAAAQIDALLQKHPNNKAIHNRLLRAGFILRDNPPELLHAQHYRIQSQSNPLTKYITWFRNGESHCMCKDWRGGNQLHTYGWEVKHPAPYLNGLGVACKHILAAYIHDRTAPIFSCPSCQGKGFFLEQREQPVRGWNDVCILCQVCQGKGVIFDEEIVEPGPMPEVDPLFAEEIPY